MQYNIILAGVGGQGILSIAYVLDNVAMEKGLYIKQSEVHGMSQRGGDVQSHIRISDKEIHSDLIPLAKADFILSVEPLEALRYISYLKPDGYIITNDMPIENIPSYPELDKILAEICKHKNNIILNATGLAKLAGSSRAENIVMLGALSNYLEIDKMYYDKFISKLFAGKGDSIVEVNKTALKYGQIAGNFYKAASESGLSNEVLINICAFRNPDAVNANNFAIYKEIDKSKHKSTLIKHLSEKKSFYNEENLVKIWNSIKNSDNADWSSLI